MKNAFVILSIFFTLSNFSTLSAECKFISPKVDLPANYEKNLEILEFSTEALRYTKDGMIITTDLSELQKVDLRKAKDLKSPSFLDAVGKITIIKNNGKKSICSGSLVSTKYGSPSRVIQSAAHCFGDLKNQKKYDIKEIIWETTLSNGKHFKQNLDLQSLSYSNDISILTLKDKISFNDIKPLIVDDEIMEYPKKMIELSSSVISAGFSTDEVKGKKGTVLTYDDSIDLSKVEGSGNKLNINTVTFQGASGGALISNADLSSEGIKNPHNQYYIIGSIRGTDSKQLNYEETSSQVLGTTKTAFEGYYSIENFRIDKYNQ